jgi:hypothetical protein
MGYMYIGYDVHAIYAQRQTYLEEHGSPGSNGLDGQLVINGDAMSGRHNRTLLSETRAERGRGIVSGRKDGSIIMTL